MADWHDNDTFWEETGPVLFTEERWKAAPGEVERILELMRLPAGAKVLDVGCGVGRHAIEFARRGCQVTGIDRTASYLDTARTKAAENKLDIEWVQADMRRFRQDGTFDLVVSLLTSFGYFRDAADDRRALENMYASLKPGGALVVELMGKEVLARIFRPRDWQEQADGTKLLEERTVHDAWSRLDNRWVIIRGDDVREHRFQLRLYCAAELRTLLESVGFVHVNAYGSLGGTPYDETAERLAVSGRKPPFSTEE